MYACCVHAVQDLHTVFSCTQKHDIIKKRLDSNGNAIEARPDGIGAPKVRNLMTIKFLLFLPISIWQFVEPFGASLIYMLH